MINILFVVTEAVLVKISGILIVSQTVESRSCRLSGVSATRRRVTSIGPVSADFFMISEA